MAEGEQGLLDLGRVLDERDGVVAGKIFPVGSWAAAMSSLVGVWNGVSLMFADFAGDVRRLPENHVERGSKGKAYKAHVLWLTCPPMLLFALGEPFWLIRAHGVLGAFCMPLLAVTLLLILNSDRVPREWGNEPVSNTSRWRSRRWCSSSSPSSS